VAVSAPRTSSQAENPAKSGDVKRDATEISNSAQGMCEMHAIRSPCPIKILGPAIAAISLNLAGRRGMSSRVGRNLRFAAAGNALTAAVMGALGTYVSIRAIFIASAILCIPALFALHQVRADEIEYVLARNAASTAIPSTSSGWSISQRPKSASVRGLRLSFPETKPVEYLD
jgi:hypothetical protein